MFIHLFLTLKNIVKKMNHADQRLEIGIIALKRFTIMFKERMADLIYDALANSLRLFYAATVIKLAFW